MHNSVILVINGRMLHFSNGRKQSLITKVKLNIVKFINAIEKQFSQLGCVHNEVKLAEIKLYKLIKKFHN